MILLDEEAESRGKAFYQVGSASHTSDHARYGWMVDEQGRKTWPVNRYSVEGERWTDWFAKGVLKYHRTIGTTLNTLIRAGFTIRAVEEFAPSPEQIESNPGLEEEMERPMMLLVAVAR